MRALLLALVAFLGLSGAPGTAGAGVPVAPPAAATEVEQPAAANPYQEMMNEAKEEAAAELAGDEYWMWVNDFSQRSWEWHLLTTKIIFFVVMFIVLFGIFVSWLQFRHDLSSVAAPSEGETNPAYDVSASLQSVSVKSKTIGAVVLLASTGFLLMYLIYVYPMHEADRALERPVPGEAH